MTMIWWSTLEKSGAMPVGAGRNWNPVSVGLVATMARGGRGEHDATVQ